MMPYHRGTPLVTIDHVSLTLGDRLILRDVHETITDVVGEARTLGQVVCVLGPSGIGKTRLARLLAGLDQPTEGTITLRDGHAVRPGDVGLVPQNYPLFRFATVRQNLLIAGRQSGRSDQAVSAQAAPLIDAFDLARYLDTYPDALSGGTRQRVAIVRQLLCSEHYVILDEPFSGLDPIMKRRACEVITTVAALDSLNTVILNTHDVTEGMAIADMVWLMGLERDEAGQTRPGARIVTRYDMAALGFAWNPDVYLDPGFLRLVADVKALFHALI